MQQLDQKVQSSTSKKIQLPVEDVLKRGGFMDDPKPRQPAENVAQSRPWASAKKPTKVMATRRPQMSGPRGKIGPNTLSQNGYG